MANEISYQIQSLLNNGGLSDNFISGSLRADQLTARVIRNVQTIGFAAEEALELGSIATPGFAVFKNLDDTNFIEIGPDSTGLVPFVKLEPGQVAMMPLAAAPWAKADTAAVELFYIVYSL
jgi:hypothetical protein